MRNGIYKAEQIAKFIINYAYEHKNPINNFQLQRFLYFLWVEYYNKSGNCLFNDEFFAWHFGAVIPSLYYEFCCYGGLPITETFSVSLDKNKNTKNVIQEFVEVHCNNNLFEFTKEMYRDNGAWNIVFNENGKGLGNRKPISFQLIIDKECSYFNKNMTIQETKQSMLEKALIRRSRYNKKLKENID